MPCRYRDQDPAPTTQARQHLYCRLSARQSGYGFTRLGAQICEFSLHPATLTDIVTHAAFPCSDPVPDSGFATQARSVPLVPCDLT